MTIDDSLSLDPVALAIQEQFLAEWHAGKRPRLSVYAARYPAYANLLAELVASLSPGAGHADDAEPLIEAHLESFPERLWTGDGINRALTSIFSEVQLRWSGAQLGHVAEERQPYETGRADARDGAHDGEGAHGDDGDEPVDQ
ncbi:MAG TPA: hypothetical protein VFN78_00070 [Ktedonobacterales bacterium]|nr:hypothetical protein [Ktedonobacterales bacterium]